MWVFDTRCNPADRSLSVEKGRLTTNCQLVNQAVTFDDYVVEVDVNVTRTQPPYIQFNNNSCLVQLGASQIEVWCDEGKIYQKKFLEQTSWRTLRFIVKGSEAAVFLDGVAIGYFEFENKGLPEYFSLGRGPIDGSQSSYANFKAWSLTYFSFP
jgi:hypothetical protein